MPKLHHISRIALLSVLSILLMAVASCSKEDGVQSEYSSHQCRFVLNFEIEGITTCNLYKALCSTNLFAIFSVLPGNPGYRIDSRLAGQGLRDTVAVRMEENVRPSRTLGLGNCLIAGNSTFEEGQLYVFDGVCPNCYETAYITKELYFTADNDKNVRCPGCKRTYGLLNGGVVVAGENGSKLFRYRASFTLNTYQNHILSVSNR